MVAKKLRQRQAQKKQSFFPTESPGERRSTSSLIYNYYSTCSTGRVLLIRPRPPVSGPDIFESATFSFRIQKFPRPHVAHSYLL